MRVLVLLLASLPLLTCALASAGAPKTASFLKHSDVVSMGSTSPETCRAFSISVIDWGGRPENEAGLAAFRTRTLDPLRAMGVRYIGSVGMVTEFARFMEYDPQWEQAVCLTARGERIRVPWLWDHSHEGNPAYWFCTNNPRYRKFLREQVTLAARSGMEGVHIDDHLGAAATGWIGGCFCDSCVAGFRDYLRAHVPPARLKEAGVGDPAAFNYRDFVRAWLDAHPEQRAVEAPLADDYRVYQYRAAEGVMADLRESALRAAGHDLAFGANAGLPDTGSLTDYRVLTQFSCEVGQDAEKGPTAENTNAILAYRLAAALKRPLTATASGQDWAFVKANTRPELVRTWITQAYAFGQFFMTMHHEWCYMEKLGTHWYDGPPEEYGPTYRFVREHPALFDGQESAAQVAVLYSTGAARRGEGKVEEMARALLAAQVPFDFVVAGDEWVPARLNEADVRRYQRVLVSPDLHLDAEQQAVLDRLRKAGRLVTWQGPETLRALPVSGVKIDGSDQVWAVLRRNAKGDAVCHLLNRDYDAATDRVRRTGVLHVSIPAGTLPGKHTAAVLYAPGAAPVRLQVKATREGVSFDVPAVGVWGVVELSNRP